MLHCWVAGTSSHHLARLSSHLPGELRGRSVVDDASALGRIAQEIDDGRAGLPLRVGIVEASSLTLQPLRCEPLTLANQCPAA